jgi:hypothetical protein
MYKKLILALLVFLIVLGGGYVWYSKHYKKTQLVKESAVVTKIDLEKAEGIHRIPAGFPQGLPLETQVVTDSSTIVYPSNNVTASVYTYSSKKSPKEVIESYKSFMNKEKYIISETLNDKGVSFINGTKDMDKLSVVVSSLHDVTLVQVSYADKN